MKKNHLLFAALLLMGCEKINIPDNPPGAWMWEGKQAVAGEGIFITPSGPECHFSNQHGREPQKYGMIIGPYVREGCLYKATMKVKAWESSQLTLLLMISQRWDSSVEFPVGTFNWREFSVHFIPPNNMNVIFLTQDSGDVWIKDLEIVEDK